MNILYSVQATGNGHISRAHQLYPHLCALGNVDIMLSGSNATLQMDIPVKYRSRGLSLFYSRCGGLDFFKTLKGFNYPGIIREAKDLPVEKYDLIINDFDHITARACRFKKVPSIQFGHQASFMSKATPRPDKKSFFGELVLKKYATASQYVGLHFDRYDDFIFPPVIKEVFIQSRPIDQGHITVYTPAYDEDCLKELFTSLDHVEFHWFLPHVTYPYKEGNIHYFPVDHTYFNDSLIHCHGLITGGGFETPSEALFLGKKLLTIPIDGQYEQQCNAAALEKMGVSRLSFLNQGSKTFLIDWIQKENSTHAVHANNIPETLSYLLSLS
ncbi:MAG: glycosyl transferase [Saprospiraceae bacterium]|nr:glycosyl transferase [Saprospiraceae bacterium]